MASHIMVDQDMAAVEPMFRANKRRKVYRRRDDGDTESNVPSVQQGVTGAGNDGDEDGSVRQMHKKHVVRKHGIAFTSTSRSQTQPQTPELELNEATAMMVVPPSREGNVLSTVSTERFMKPTGKAAVVDDKHMYVSWTQVGAGDAALTV